MTASAAAQAVTQRMQAHFRGTLGLQGVVALHEPWFQGNEWAYVKDCLDTGWVSSVGAYVDRFEQMVAAACGTRFGVAAVNGTAALHIVLHGLGVGPDDLVVCPALSFAATANAVAHCGAQPAFVDIQPDTLGMDPARLGAFLAEECRLQEGRLIHQASGRRVAAVVPVHIFGHPVDMDAIVQVCASYRLPVVEDAAEALGSLYHGRKCGGLGHAAIISFNGNKLVTTGGGGMVVTNDETLARRIKHLSTTARCGTGWTFDHDEVGWNYRLPNINAALGCAQMENLDGVVALKRRLHQTYTAMLAGIDGVEVFSDRDWAQGNYWLNAILLPGQQERDALLDAANASGLQCRPCWRLLPDLPMYANAPMTTAGVPVARQIAARLVNLPSSPFLAQKEAP